MSNGPGRKYGVLQDTILFIAFYAGIWYTANHFINKLTKIATSDPESQQHEEARIKATANLRRLDRDGGSKSGPTAEKPSQRVEDLVLDKYESVVAMEVVAPQDIPVGFDDIGGLEDIIEELKESVIYPLTMPHLYSHSSSLLSAPSGVLLYGPPGCGKTMLAKALAHESGASFINLHISTMTEKWYGDSNKLVRAVFSLARKLQPSIVFIDEIDAVLGTRRSGEHEASAMVKAEFMTLWDGLNSADATGTPARIMVLGATNRMQDIDSAILRRMPKKFPVSLPSKPQRRRILDLILKDTKTDPEHFDIEYVTQITAGLSGSDIKEACRDAAMMPMRELIREQRARGLTMADVKSGELRGIRTEDFLARQGGEQTLATNHRNQPQQRPSHSSDEYEDVEEGPFVD